jgi:hypothetical protein
MRVIRKIFFLLAAIATAIAPSLPASAQSVSTVQGLNVEISPLPIQLNAKPGSTVHTDLRVRNSGSSSEQLKASLKTFSAEGPDGHIVLHDPGPNDEFTKWVSFDRSVFDAPAGQWQTVKMTVSLPASAAFGYYYGVQFELANPPKPKPGVTHLRGAVVTFVLLNAQAPGASRKIEVTRFASDHSSYEFLPVNFQVAVRNSGNVHTAPHGNIFIKRGGKQVAALSVNATDGMVLPHSNRVFGASWKDGFPVYETVTDENGQPVKDANGKVKTQLKWDFSKASKLRFGHYTAQLLLVYNDGQRDIPIEGTLSFWVIPWRIIATMLVIGIFVAIGFWSTFKKAGRFAKRQTKRTKKDA